MSARPHNSYRFRQVNATLPVFDLYRQNETNKYTRDGAIRKKGSEIRIKVKTGKDADSVRQYLALHGIPCGKTYVKSIMFPELASFIIPVYSNENIAKFTKLIEKAPLAD